MRTRNTQMVWLVALAATTGMLLVSVDRLEAQEPREGDKPAAKDDAKKPADAKKRPAATAPQYTWLKVSEEARRNRNFVVFSLKRTFPTGDSIKKFDDYYKYYGFMKLVDKKFLGSITDVRDDFRRDLRDAKPKAYERLNKLAGVILPKIVKNTKFHPASRYNATLILGDLNREKPARGKEPIPLTSALPFLVGDALMDPRQSDAVRVAAMIGIRRHAEVFRKYKSEKLEKNRELTIDSMLKIAQASKVSGNRTADGHHWMRRQAVEILGEIGDVGVGAKVAKALVVVASEKDSPLWLRCAAAHSLGRLKLKPADATIVKPEIVAKTLKDLAADVCKAELERATAERLAVSQEQLLADLGCIQAGVTAITSTGQPKGGVADFVKNFESVYSKVESSPGGLALNSQVASGLHMLLAEKKPEPPPEEVKPKEPMVDSEPKPVDPKPPGPKKEIDLDFGD